MNDLASSPTGVTKVSQGLEDDGAVLRLILDNPPGNVIDTEMVAGLRQAFAAAREMDNLKLIIISGNGRHFSFGASVEEHRPEKVRAMLEGFHGLVRDIMSTDIPSLALVRGQCLGGGLELAAFCDWVFAVDGATMGQPEIQLGVFAPLGSLILPWRCRARGIDLLLTGASVDADTALAIGLADKVLPKDGAETLLKEWARDNILTRSAASLRRARRAARWSLHRMIGDGLDELERLYLEDLMQTQDAVEGIQAFLEKRRPVWIGK